MKMLTVSFESFLEFDKVAKAAHQGSVRAMFRLGGFVQRISSRSIRKKAQPRRLKSGKMQKKKASPVGKPPFSHAPHFRLRKSIRFNVDKRAPNVFVGVPESLSDGFAGAHELGLAYKGDHFKKRPFMAPALEKALPKIPEQFRDML